MFFLTLCKSKKSTWIFVDNVDNLVYNSTFPRFSTIFNVYNFEDKMWEIHPPSKSFVQILQSWIFWKFLENFLLNSVYFYPDNTLNCCSFFYVTFLLYKDVGGERPPTMIPTDRYVLRTLAILPNIRISWDIHPTFMLICVCRPWDPGII